MSWRKKICILGALALCTGVLVAATNPLAADRPTTTEDATARHYNPRAGTEALTTESGQISSMGLARPTEAAVIGDQTQLTEAELRELDLAQAEAAGQLQAGAAGGVGQPALRTEDGTAAPAADEKADVAPLGQLTPAQWHEYELLRGTMTQEEALRALGVDIQFSALKETPLYVGGGLSLRAPIPCPANSMFSQLAHEPGDAWTGATADEAAGYERFDTYTVSADICDVHWWGFNRFHDGVSFSECDKTAGGTTPDRYNIRFYADSAGEPAATPTCEYLDVAVDGVTLVKTVTGVDYSGRALYQYDLNLSALTGGCCSLTSGWVSIQGVDDGQSCWLLWMSSGDGDAASCIRDVANVTSCGLPDNDFDLSVCLTEELADGACCDQDAGICNNGVGFFECSTQVSNWRFLENGDCGDFDPACGVAFGACCMLDGSCTELTNLDCANTGGVFSGDGTSCTPNDCPQPCACGSPISTFPYNEDFEGEGQCSTSCNGACALVGDWTNITDGSDDIDWASDVGGTPSSSTGPTIDGKPGTSAGHYLYTESSSPCYEVTAIVMSPCFDVSSLTTPQLIFGYHMYGQSMGDLYVEVSDTACTSWDTVMTISGQQQVAQADPWLYAAVNLGAYSGATDLRIRFRGVTGNNFYSDMAIDDVTLQELQVFTGACCNDDACTVVSEADCISGGGVYKGDFTDCGPPNPCIGACCKGDGSCEELTSADCATSNGIYLGDGTDCVSDLCPPGNDDCDKATNITSVPFEELDISMPDATDDPNVNPSCDSSSNTAANNGVWYTYTPAETCAATIDQTGLDAATSVWTGPDCNNLTQVTCSDPDPFSVDLTGGTLYWILVSNWSSAEPTAIMDFNFDCVNGACCSNGVCTIETPANCAALGGTYVGDSTTCTPDPCSVGGCCFPDGSCQVLGETDCINAGGSYQGDATSCATVICNDVCDGATVISAVPYSTTFDNSLAAADGPPGTCNTTSATVMQNDVWFSYTATEDCFLVLDVDPDFGAGYDGLMQLYTGPDCNNLTGMTGLPGEDDPGCYDLNEPWHVEFAASNGVTYWFQVGDWGTGAGGGLTSFDLNCQPGVFGACCHSDGSCTDEAGLDPAGDCATAGGVYQGDFTSCATAGCPQPCPCTTAITVFPYNEEFEAEPTCSGTCAAACTLVGDWLNIADGTDDIDWTIDEGGTGSLDTGPSQDANPGTPTGNYAYTESSSPCQDTTAILLSPCFDISSLAAPQLSFAYHMYGATTGSIHVEVSTDDCASWTTELTLSGEQQNDETDPWKYAFVDLSAYSAATDLRIRFRGEVGTSFTSDMALDDIRLGEEILVIGACCNSNGTCTEVEEDECVNALGVWFGFQTTCSEVTCGGACCFADESCLDTVSQAECIGTNGLYQGDGTDCATTVCPPSNDVCATATPINCNDTLIGETNENANNDYDPTSSGCTGFAAVGPDVVYVFTTPPTDQIVTVVMDPLPYVSFDASVYVVTDCNDVIGSCVAGEDGGNPETLIFAADANQTYYIICDTYSTSGAPGGMFDLSVSCVADVCCPSTVSTYPYCDNLESGFVDWTNGISDDLDWTLLSGPTLSLDTGPSFDHTTSNGFYAYTEATGPAAGDTAILNGPCFDLSSLTSPQLTFWYHMWGAAMGTLSVEVSNDDCQTWNVEWTLSGDQGDQWHQAVVDLSASYAGDIVRIRFVGVIGSSFTSDMAIDDIAVDDDLAGNGACCEINGSCTDDVDETTCLAGGGAWLGAYSYCDCASAACPPAGACCLGGACTEAFKESCDFSGGLYGGDNTTCASGDCNGNSADDFCDILAGTSADCNNNAVPDECDIAGATSQDCDGNGVPDECDSDCNTNGIPDGCDVTCGADCNTPECYQGLCGTSDDCQPDGVPDECQLGRGGARAIYQHDDGTHEDAIGITAGARIAALNHFTVTGGEGKITAVLVAWGPVTNGTPATVYLWEDPNGDGDPHDAQVLASAPTVVANSDLDIFNQVDIPPTSVGPDGTSFFVGFLIDSNQYCAAIDETSSAGESWVAGDIGYAVDPNDLGNPAYNNPLSLVDALGFPGNWMIRAIGEAGGGGGGDCNTNGIPDDCDVPPICDQGPPICSPDCNADLVPDECQLDDNDCDQNGIPDDCDIADCTPGDLGCADCNGNGKPDKCDLPDNDCNGNEIPDDCDIANCPPGDPDCADCNGNGIPDECDIADCTPGDLSCGDCNTNGRPDECDLTGLPGGRVNLVLDPSFEAGTPNPFWAESSTNFGTPLCDGITCNSAVGSGPHTGSWWVWYGGITGVFEAGAVEQDIVLPVAGTTTLEFYVEIPTPSGNGTDFLRAKMDGNILVTILESDAGYATYALVSVDISSYADGGLHTLRFEGEQSGSPALSNIFLDDISIEQTGPPANDCNQNGVPDDCDVDPDDPDGNSQVSRDCDEDGVPDECQLCGDLDGDEDVDPDDYQLFLYAFGSVDGGVRYNPCADYDDSGAVGMTDYQTWLLCYRDFRGDPQAAPPGPRPRPRPVPVPVPVPGPLQGPQGGAVQPPGGA